MNATDLRIFVLNLKQADVASIVELDELAVGVVRYVPNLIKLIYSDYFRRCRVELSCKQLNATKAALALANFN